MAGNNGRGPDGKFAPGNKLSPGRPKKSREEKFQHVAVTAVSLTEWRLIVKKAVIDAQRGNAAARNWLTQILLGPLAPKDNEVTINLPDVIAQALDRGYGENGNGNTDVDD